MCYNFEIIKNSRLPEEKLKEIIKLKNQSWQYPFSSQKNWIKNNLCDEDVHLLMYNENRLVGYLDIVEVSVSLDDKTIEMLGIGNVCVDKSFLKQGLGKKLVLRANQEITNKNKTGVLLCHENLVAFYKKCGWSLVKYSKLKINQEENSCYIMFLQENEILVNEVLINRAF